jgi:hypothetical protein
MFIIVWRGLGWLVAVLVFGLSLIGNVTCDAIYGDGYYDHHKWPFAVSLLVAGASCWFLGLYLKRRSDRIVVDKATGQELVLNQSRHTLFFVPMHLWGPVLGVIALVVLAVSLSSH